MSEELKFKIAGHMMHVDEVYCDECKKIQKVTTYCMHYNCVVCGNPTGFWHDDGVYVWNKGATERIPLEFILDKEAQKERDKYNFFEKEMKRLDINLDIQIFRHTKTAWLQHKNKDDELCNSRIERLYYKWQDRYTIVEYSICIDCNAIGIRDPNNSEE